MKVWTHAHTHARTNGSRLEPHPISSPCEPGELINLDILLKNWRPITLLNVIYKLMSSAIANRLKTVLDKLIYQDQNGYISGRYIGKKNIRLVYDILFETKQQNIVVTVLSLVPIKQPSNLLRLWSSNVWSS